MQLRSPNRFALLAFLLFAISATDCTVLKRRYTKGWHVSFRNSQGNTISNKHEAVKDNGIMPDYLVKHGSDANRRSANTTVSAKLSLLPEIEQVKNHYVYEVQSANPEVVVQNGADVKRKKVEPLGIFAFAISIASWFTSGFLTFPLFLLAAVLAVVSLNIISNSPERYLLKTLSLVALIVAVVGSVLSLYTLIFMLMG